MNEFITQPSLISPFAIPISACNSLLIVYYLNPEYRPMFSSRHLFTLSSFLDNVYQRGRTETSDVLYAATLFLARRSSSHHRSFSHSIFMDNLSIGRQYYTADSVAIQLRQTVQMYRKLSTRESHQRFPITLMCREKAEDKRGRRFC